MRERQTTRFAWPGFELVYAAELGTAITHYPDGTRSGCGIVPDDQHHAYRLGIIPGEHRLLHELAHHLVADVLYGPGAGVVWRDAHGEPQESGGMVKHDWSEADREEWCVTALCYRTLGCGHRAGAIDLLRSEGCAIEHTTKLLRWLLDAARFNVAAVHL